MVGRHGQLARALSETGAGLVGLGRDSLDLADSAAAERVVREHEPDLVINAAAYTDVDGAEDDAATAFAVNRDGVAGLARGAAAVGAALIHVSTDYVYDGRKRGAWTESDPTGPLNVYGASKLAGEAAALAANPRTLVLRTSWVYAPWGRNFVTAMLRLADRERLRIVDDQQGNPTAAPSLARAIVAMSPRVAGAPAGASIWGVRHYAGRGTTTWAGFAREIFALARGRLVPRAPEVVPIRSSEYPTRAERPLNSTLDCSAFERDFGIATEAWRDSLARVIERIVAENAAG